MVRRSLIAVAFAALLVSSASGARRQVLQSTTQELMPGVSYTREVDFTPRGPVVLDVVTAPKPDGSLYTLAPVLARGQTLSGIEQGLAATATTVGVNGDFFATAAHQPSGIVIRGGALDEAPAAARSSLGIAPDGTLSVARVAYKGTWQGSGQRRSLDLNLAPAKGHATLYTPSWGAATPAESGVVEVVLPSFPAAKPNQPLTGTVAQVVTAGPTPIPPGGAVLVARGLQGQALQTDAPVGQQVEVRLNLTPVWSGMASALGGGPLLVAKGKPVFDAKESFAAKVVNVRGARSAIGQLKDGRILLVTVEGGRPAYSAGMTAYELAVALVRLGAVTAVGLGSGNPAGMAFDGTLLTQPSGGTEQVLGDALVLSYAGVYAAPPTADVLSPNGDGVADTESFAYKTVRPAHVTAAVTGPAGATVVLADDQEQPGVHTLAWDGAAAAEGAWTFTVTAADDLGRTTSAQRAFTLDDTLGALSIAPPATATFQLTRAATVVVTAERRNGVAVATLLDSQLQPGPQTVTWDGAGADGKKLPAGGYQIHVVATSAIGRSELTAPVTLP
ncbi:MAG TPA: phosphodiester glycosidase family protein [Gaiellaceae bacterium]|nr:phosphodiester glycosidase family protein [Gaiellaceae bacterium]